MMTRSRGRSGGSRKRRRMKRKNGEVGGRRGNPMTIPPQPVIDRLFEPFVSLSNQIESEAGIFDLVQCLAHCSAEPHCIRVQGRRSRGSLPFPSQAQPSSLGAKRTIHLQKDEAFMRRTMQELRQRELDREWR